MTLDQQLYELAFAALGRVELPNFSAYDSQLVFTAFRRLYGDKFEVDKDQATFICNEVQRVSNGRVSMQQIKVDSGINGPNAQFVLSEGELEKKVYFGPYATPFGFF